MSGFAPAPPHEPAKIRHFLSIADLTSPELQKLVDRARQLKSIIKDGRDGHPNNDLLKAKTIALLFNKRSTRTRVSTESAVTLLGGQPMFLGREDVQLGVNESLYDSARVISSMVHGIVARVAGHQDVVELSRYSDVPVINALSDTFHPCQAVADIMTIQEHQKQGETGKVTCAWVGDANNVLHDFLNASTKSGYNFRIATPSSRPVDEEILECAREFADEKGGVVYTTSNPEEAVKGANFVVTDTWISMGEESQRQSKMREFAGYQVTRQLLDHANKGCKFMHCLPRHAEEVTDDVFYSSDSVVFQEAENRKWAMLAILEFFMSQKY